MDFSSMKQSVSSAVEELKKLERQDALLDSELNKLRQTAGLTSQAMDEQAEKVKILSAKLETAKSRADTYKKGMEEMKSTIARAAQEQKDLTAKIQENLEAQKKAEDRLKNLAPAYQDAQKAIKAAADEYGTESEACQKAVSEHEKAIKSYESAAAKADELKNQLAQLEGKQKLVNTVMEQAEGQLDDYQIALNNAQADVAALAAELKEAESRAMRFGDSMQTAGDHILSAADKAGEIGTKLTVGVTTPIIGLGTAAVKAGNDFEAQMSRVSAIAGAYGDDLEKLRDMAIELGAETSFSATESAQAMENLASAGFSTEEIMQAMPGMLDLAASSGEDLASSADIAASTLRGFQLNASEAGHVADVLAKNAADTNAAIIDTGYAMKYVAPVAQSVGWSLEEVTAAIGVMADAGIKGEQAGTTLRGALTRLMKPTDAMQSAMDSLGITFYDSQGKMKPLSTIIDELQKSTEELTDEQRDNKLATIFGTEALSGMKVLLASSKDELDTMTDGLKKADGAAEKMADTMLDNTKGSIEEMNGSLETAGITIQKQLAPWITKGAEMVTDLANQFADLDENTQGTILTIGGIAAASGPVIKGLSGVTGGIGKLVKGTGGLIKDLGKISSAKKAAEAIGEIGSFSSKSVEGVSGLSKVLYKLGSPAGIAVMATGVLAGIGVAVYNSMQQAKQAAIDADLARRFGDIELSMEDVEDIAEQLTTNEWTMQVDAVINAKEELDTLREQVQSTVDSLNKTGWKISMGLELSQEENESFRTDMDSFVKDSIAYLQQKQYTATLAVNTYMVPGTESYQNVSEFVDEFYTGSQKEMQDLGDMLASEVDKALADGVITEDEYLNIQNIQSKLQEFINRTENAEYTAKIKSLQLQAEGGNLTADSFKNIMSTAGEQLQSQMDAADQGFLDMVAPLQIQLEEGKITQEQFDEMLRDYQEKLNRQKGELILDTVTVGVETLQINYENELDTFRQGIESTVDDFISGEFIVNDPGNNNAPLIFYPMLEGAINDDFRMLSDEARGSAQELLDSMQPETSQLEEVAKAYREAGQIPPENIRKGLEDVYELQMMAGNTEYLYKFLAQKVAQSPEMQKTLIEARENGQSVPEELAAGLRDLYGLEMVERNGQYVWDTVGDQAMTSAQVMQSLFHDYGLELPESLAQGMDSKSADAVNAAMLLLQKLQTGTALQKEDLTSVFSTLGIDLPQNLINSLATQEAGVQQQTIQLLTSLEGAEQLKKEELTTLFSTLGLDVSDSLVQSISEKEPDVQAKMVDLITQLKTAEGENREDLLVQMLQLGRDVDTNLCDGIAQDLGLVEDAASGTVSVIDRTTNTEIARISPDFAKRLEKMGATGFEAMDKEISSEDLSAPDVEDLSTQPVKDWREDSQSYLDENPLVATFQRIYQNVMGWTGSTRAANNADGGIIEKQTLSWLAEGDQPEAVIPLSASKRSRGIELWQQAGEQLGVLDAARNMMGSYATPSAQNSGSRQLAAALAAELRKAPISVNPQFHVSSGDVYLEKEPVGRSLAPVIDTELNRLTGTRRRGG